MTESKKKSWVFGSLRMIEKESRKMQYQPKLQEWKSKVCESLAVKQSGANNERGKKHRLWLL